MAPIARQGHAPAGGTPGPGVGATPKLPTGIPPRYLSSADSPWDVEVPADGKRDVELTLRKN